MKKLTFASALILISFTQTGCLFTYLIKSGKEQMSILNSRQPIEKVLESNDVTESDKSKLRLALEVREFVVQELGFKASDNYKTYVDIKRPFVTWVVIASPKNKVENYIWKYPIVGKLPYKGFFNPEDAKKEAKKFDPTKYDTYVRGVSAYSTLGWFNDPILSTMLKDDESDLVNLIIHESAHATIFIKSEAAFNERLATFLGNKGTEIFYLKKEGEKSKTLERVALEDHDEKLFSAFITDEVKTLNEWYAKEVGLDEEKRLARLKEINERFTKVLKPKMKTERYARFAKANINNAFLSSLHTYVYDLSDFQNLLRILKGDMKALIKFCKELERAPDPALKLKEYLRQQSP
jgi:predicted aminopeptidase